MFKPNLLILVLMFLVTASCGGRNDVTTFILVRHAEKGNDGTEDPDLTTSGEARARRLAFMLKDTPLEAIYSTDFKRTKRTVEPISDIQDLDVQIYEAHQPEAVQRMIEAHRGGTVLITGHSNNIPWTANLLLGRETFEDYDENEYGTILIVSVFRDGSASSVTRLNY